MDYDKLIERLHKEAYGSDMEELLLGASTAIETLRTEAVKLQYEAERQRRSADDMRHLCENAERPYTKAQADLARVTAERDEAIKSIPHDCKTCVYHTVFFNGCTPDHDCTNPDGGCSNNYDRWKWRGIKED